MQPCTFPPYWQQFLDVVLPQVDVVLQGIAVWVVLKIRSTSRAELQTLSSLVTSVQRSDESPEPRGSRRTAPVRRKSSTKGITSTSPGEREKPDP